MLSLYSSSNIISNNRWIPTSRNSNSNSR